MKNIDLILPLVRKPGRYINGELGTKIHTSSNTSCVIAFPDVYEVGMSSLGVRILYHLFQKSGIRVERVFSPWVDMEEKLRRNEIPLSSLETRTPLKDFDLVAFSIQYELNYTNILSMLDLAGIPLYSKERQNDHPIVVAGGTSVFNPLPILPFFDAFLIGDAEEFVPAIIPIFKDKSTKRNEKLKELSKLPGVLLPDNVGNSSVTVKKISIDTLPGDTIPDSPILPFIEIIHDRLVVEIARGCTRGCRFCQAGIIYRPYRERDRETVMKAVLQGLLKTGYKDVTLLALSVLDHSDIEGIISDLRRKNIGVSLPSLRGDSLNSDIASLLCGGSVTLAPEAGTERLRRIINKDIDEDDMIESTKRLKSFGFTHAKLYFMIGLPQETEEDIEGIVKLINTIRRNIPLKVSISPFVPRPHTPFQWVRQNNIEELQEKINYLKRYIKKTRVAYREPEGCLLEGVFSRGDERLSAVIERAYRLGARFDEWSEMFDFTRWNKAFDKEGINPNDYLKERDIDKPLPWDTIDTGVDKGWLVEERELSINGKMRRDCRIIGCSGCGICDGNIVPIKKKKGNTEVKYGRMAKSLNKPYAKIGYRIKYSKIDNLRYIGHLDTTNALIRTLRRAKLPLVYSQGYKPKPRVAFSPPLTLGFTSSAEYIDVLCKRTVPDIEEKFKETTPEGFVINSVEMLPPKYPSLSSSLVNQRLQVNLTQKKRGYVVPHRGGAEEFIDDFMENETLEVDGINVRPAVLEIIYKDDCVEILMKLCKAKPLKIFQVLFNITEDEARLLKVERIGWK